MRFQTPWHISDYFKFCPHFQGFTRVSHHCRPSQNPTTRSHPTALIFCYFWPTLTIFNYFLSFLIIFSDFWRVFSLCWPPRSPSTHSDTSTTVVNFPITCHLPHCSSNSPLLVNFLHCSSTSLGRSPTILKLSPIHSWAISRRRGFCNYLLDAGHEWQY